MQQSLRPFKPEDRFETYLLRKTMTQALKGKLALVTGASRGIGAAIAARLAREGASVIVHYASSSARAEAVVKEIRDAGGEAEVVGANLSRPEGIENLIASLNGAFGGRFEGRLDILVNNAGTVEYGPFLDSSETSYDTHFNLNVRAPIELAKDAAARMVAAGWGRIINVGSAFGEAAPLPGVTLYIASKFALRGFTRGLSRELGKYGVTVNAVQPGPIDTELAPQPGTEDHATMTKLASVGRFGKPEEIAAAVAYLASPEAGYTTGESLTVDGGWIA
ncbi:3-oxoacyl-ACP reductase family protein [Paraburkholderia caribensis]|uniref:3-oxoacyl-ACP reductase family protein n=2 Tax=Paraburkholderia caribensis TaxID=75105 RepID=A0ABV0DRL2_9BURK|nr:3-oxoacyl-ACP reductase family protein [Paraburkholderia caribensis]MCO4878971.1 3-oxoacyl-ACP reductase FabG [Paraburkholderia caribensis]